MNEAAYTLITEGQGEFAAETAADALAAAYERGESDEFVKATTVGAPVRVEDGDAVVFMNFRADRARELSRAFVEPAFSGFPRQRELKLAGYVMLTQYAADIPAPCAFPAGTLVNVLGEYLAAQGKTQLRIAETEKYAHVTFFFSGGREVIDAGGGAIAVNIGHGRAEVAEAVAGPLGWDTARIDEEIARATEKLRSAHRVDLAESPAQRRIIVQHRDALAPGRPRPHSLV